MFVEMVLSECSKSKTWDCTKFKLNLQTVYSFSKYFIKRIHLKTIQNILESTKKLISQYNIKSLFSSYNINNGIPITIKDTINIV